MSIRPLATCPKVLKLFISINIVKDTIKLSYKLELKNLENSRWLNAPRFSNKEISTCLSFRVHLNTHVVSKCVFGPPLFGLLKVNFVFLLAKKNLRNIKCRKMLK